MSDWVEHIARAIAATHTADKWERIDDQDRNRYLTDARAAIEALRNQTRPVEVTAVHNQAGEA